MIKTAELLNCSLCCNSISNCSINIAIKINQVFLRTWILKRELRNENKNLPCLQLLSYHVLIDGRKKTIYLMNELFSFYRIHVVSGGERSNSGRKLWNPIVWPFSQVLQTVLCIRFLRFLNFSAHLGRKTKSFYGGLRWAVAKQHAGVKVTPRESVYCVRITLLLWICYLMLCRVQCFLDY